MFPSSFRMRLTGLAAIAASAMIALPLIAPIRQLLGKFRRGQPLAALIQNAQNRPLRNRPGQQRHLSHHPAALLVLNLDHPGRANTNGAAGLGESVKIIVNKGKFRAISKSTHRTDVYPHQPFAAAAVPAGSHIFSSW